MSVKINVRYGYDEMYPKEEYESKEKRFRISQVGSFDFENMMFYPEVGDCFVFEYDKAFKVEHDIIMGLPVYIQAFKY